MALAVPLSRFTPRVGGGSALVAALRQFVKWAVRFCFRFFTAVLSGITQWTEGLADAAINDG
jgi:hypothetical protein